MVKKATPTPKETPGTSLGEVAMVYTRSSSHWYGLQKPMIVEIEGTRFLEGTQVTGKVGHRMEGKRTLIPLEHVASIVEFATEEDLWSEPQPRHIRPPEEGVENTLLTSHEQPAHPHDRGPRGGPHGRHRHPRGGHKGGRDSNYQDRRGFDRGGGFNR